MDLTIIVSDLGFAEGPLWHPEGYLLFSDVERNQILKWHGGNHEVYLSNSGLKGKATEAHFATQTGSNGLALHPTLGLVFCQHGEHAISRLDTKGNVEVLVDQFEGRRLNSPNDLCIGNDGSIYFTDPPYGLKEQQLQPSIAQSHAGIYRLLNGQLSLISTALQFPNGICLSADNTHLYVGSNQLEERGIQCFELVDGKWINPRIVIEENADGLKVDTAGHFFLATGEGIKIYSADGRFLHLIATPEMATNVCVLDDCLYITTPHTVYRSIRP